LPRAAARVRARQYAANGWSAVVCAELLVGSLGLGIKVARPLMILDTRQTAPDATGAGGS
jgi:hypothetical protein